jgi:hypothetical protein
MAPARTSCLIAPERVSQRLAHDFEAMLPEWSPDGLQIVFERVEGGVFHVYKIGADGSGVTIPIRPPLPVTAMKLKFIARTLIPIAALLIAPGCGTGDPTRPSLCASAVAVSVGRGLQPAIDWQPTCAVASVLVTSTAAGASLPAWWASTQGGGGLAPPVQVGASPPGASVWGAGAALTAGSAYTVYVTRGGRGDPTGGVDSLTFTAQP